MTSTTSPPSPTLDSAQAAPPPRRLRASNPTIVLSVILITQLMVVLDATIVNVALPRIQAGLDFSPAGLSWVVNAYTLAFGGLLLLGARAGDLLGRRRTFLAGIGLFTLASLAGGLAGSAGMLLVARAAQGIGGALAAPSALALLTTMFAEGRERTRALGLYTAVSISGSAVGLLAGGMLTAWLSWRWVLFVNVPIGVVLVLLARVVVRETPRHTGRFDLAGAVTSTLGMVGVVYGFVHAASAGWGDPTTVAAFALGGLLLLAFVAQERRAPSPITPLGLFADASRTSAYLARLLLMAGMMGMLFFLTQFLQEILGYSPLRTGLAFLPVSAALFASSQASARFLIERFGSRPTLILGLALSTGGLLWLSQLSQTSAYPAVLGPLVLFGLGNGLAFVPLTAAGLAGVAPSQAGAASGMINVMQQLGGALGLAVLVSAFGAASREAAAHPLTGAGPIEQAHQVFVAGADRAFFVAATFLAGTLLLAAVAIRTRRAPAGSLPTPADSPPAPADPLPEG